MMYINTRLSESIINDVSLMDGTETTLFSFWFICLVSFYFILMSSMGIYLYEWIRSKFSKK